MVYLAQGLGRLATPLCDGIAQYRPTQSLQLSPISAVALNIVMRRCDVIFMSIVLALAGCASPRSREALDFCLMNDQDHWSLEAKPSNSVDLLSTPTENGTINSNLRPRGSNSSVHEHWFRRGDDEIAVCRHTLAKEQCNGESVTARFVRVSGRWTVPDGVLSSVCVTQGSETTHNKSLERTRER